MCALPSGGPLSEQNVEDPGGVVHEWVVCDEEDDCLITLCGLEFLRPSRYMTPTKKAVTCMMCLAEEDTDDPLEPWGHLLARAT